MFAWIAKVITPIVERVQTQVVSLSGEKSFSYVNVFNKYQNIKWNIMITFFLETMFEP